MAAFHPFLLIGEELSARQSVLIEQRLQLFPFASVIALIASLQQMIDEFDGLGDIRPTHFRRLLLVRMLAGCSHALAEIVV